MALRRGRTTSPPGGDYCFNHFQTYREEDRAGELADDDGMELSCLHLGFFLASWGMMRGQAPLHGRSPSYLKPVVEIIAAAPPEV